MDALTTAEIIAALDIELARSDTLPSADGAISIDRSEQPYGLIIAKMADGIFLLSDGGSNEIAIEPAAARLFVRTDEDTENPSLKHALLDDAVPRLLSHREIWTFHMGGVLMPDGVVALSGRSGAGKSSLVAALVGDGAGLLSDDGLIIEKQDDETVVSAPYPSLRLWSDSLSLLCENQREMVLPSGPVGKSAIQMTEATVTRKHRLDAIYLLERSEAANMPQAKSLSPSAGAFTLIDSVFGLDLTDETWKRALVDAASEFASDVPVFVLKYPSGLEQIDKTVGFLRERHGSKSDFPK